MLDQPKLDYMNMECKSVRVMLFHLVLLRKQRAMDPQIKKEMLSASSGSVPMLATEATE